MKRYNNLFKKICTYSNFDKALDSAFKNKKHYTEVKRIKRSRIRYVHKLYNVVKNKEYKVGEYTIYDLFTGGKWREIYRLPMKDRIVQHAIMMYLEPLFRANFIPTTFQSIKGRGTHKCLKKVKKALKDIVGTKYCLKLDIKKCYPSLDKNILKAKIAKMFKDKDLVELLFVIIDSCEKGVPIGNYTSQYFNNYYFSGLDHYCKEVLQIKYYFRYCDDIIVFGETTEKLRELHIKINNYINKLNVKLKDSWRIFDVTSNGVDFVGYILYRDHIRLRKCTKLKFIEACKSMDFNNLSPRDINVLGSYWGILKHADCRNLWFKYTGVKTFNDLHVKVHERMFVRDILGKEIVVTNINTFTRRGEQRIKIVANVDDYKDVYITTSGEMLVEAARQLGKDAFPFTTKIVETDNGYYKFI